MVEFVRVINKKIDKKQEFTEAQSATHITHAKDILNNEIVLLGLSQKEVVIEGEVKTLTILYTNKGCLYTSAHSFALIAKDIANIFEDDITEKGLKVKITQEKIRGDKTIYKVLPI